MIHVTGASSLSKAICHALGSKGGREHLWAPVNCVLTWRRFPTRSFAPMMRSYKVGEPGHTDSDRPCGCHLLPKHTHSHLSHIMSVLGGTETIPSKPLISQTRNLRPRESTRWDQGHPASQCQGQPLGRCPFHCPALLPRCSIKDVLSNSVGS